MNLNQNTSSTKDKRICTTSGIQVSALIGGPLSAFYLISKNFEAFGNKLEAKRHLLYGLLSTIVLFGLIGLIPAKVVNQIPSYIIPAIYIGLFSVYAQKAQGNAIKEGLLAGIQKYSNLKILGISILSLIITAVFSISITLCLKEGTTGFLGNIENGIGELYQQGIVLPQNNTTAVKWFRKASELGSSDAENNLGASYHAGNGVAQNDILAARWYLKSAEQGNVIAENNLGYAYHAGQGVTQSDVDAMNWTRKAAEQGDAQAQMNLALAYHLGTGVDQSDAEALQWLQKAAAQGVPQAHDLLQQLNQNS